MFNFLYDVLNVDLDLFLNICLHFLLLHEHSVQRTGVQLKYVFTRVDLYFGRLEDDKRDWISLIA